MNAQEFVNKWRGVELKERSFYQEHFLDLCELVGHAKPAAFDPKGERFTFEAGAGRGFADVWKKGFFAWEYKGARKDLDGAYDQLLRYRESLENPPLLIAGDAHLIRIHTNFTNSVKREYEIELDDLLDQEKLALLRWAFFEPQRLKAPETPEQVTEQAAKEFGRLAEIAEVGEDPAKTAHFLIRLLFCLFAEDIGLLPKDLFTRLVARTRRNSKAFAGQLRQLFGTMATGGWFGEHEITHFDGGLFDSDFALEMESDGIELLAGVSGLDWSSIEPSILGTLFERSLDPGKRAQLGAHYTSREDILLIVEPVLMAPLLRRWGEVESEARALAARRDKAKTDKTKRDRNRDIVRLLDGFAEETRRNRVLDPACGSGNFLYVALRQMLELWRKVSNLAGELGLPLMMPTSAPSPEQLYGIEINAYAHELAQATIWIGYIQWLRENGFGQPAEPILKKLDNIKLMDAILAYDEAGNPVEPEWPEAKVVIGNPPFLGDKKMRGELGDEYVDKLRFFYNDALPGQSDLVCYWFEKARIQLSVQKAKRVGLLATQGIRGGANRSVLDRIKSCGDIFFAYSDRDWIQDGTAVHVSMIGFDLGNEKEKELDGKKVENINSNLTSTVDINRAKTLNENGRISFIGTQKSGPFDLKLLQAKEMIKSLGNPNGRSNSDVIKPWINAIDITRSRNMWIIDFGTDMGMDQAAQYEKPFEYVLKNVKPIRDNVRRKGHRKYWWRFGETRRGMRRAIKDLKRYIGTPMVSKHRVFVWIDKKVIAENLVVVFAREDEYFWGILQSKIHELWSLVKGTQLREAESGSRYTSSSVFMTYPFPWVPGEEPVDDPRVVEVGEAAKELNEKRERWLNPTPPPAPPLLISSGTTQECAAQGEGSLEFEAEMVAFEKMLKKRTLTNLYNERPTWLQLAHERLDRAVMAAYGWEYGISDEEILERLLALNLERAKRQEEA